MSRQALPPWSTLPIGETDRKKTIWLQKEVLIANNNGGVVLRSVRDIGGHLPTAVSQWEGNLYLCCAAGFTKICICKTCLKGCSKIAALRELVLEKDVMAM